MWRQTLIKWSPILALYLIWPAMAVVVWGELTPHLPSVVDHIWDKLLHFTAYFGLSGLAAVALQGRRGGWLAVPLLMLLGGILEILQGFTGRDPSLYDEFANTLGAVSGFLAGLGALAVLRRPLVEGRTSD